MAEKNLLLPFVFTAAIPEQLLQILVNNLLQLTKKYPYAAVFYSNSLSDEYPVLAAFAANPSIYSANDVSLNNKWLFGYLSYELKNELEELHSRHPDFFNLPSSCFFEPEILIYVKDRQLYINSTTHHALADAGQLYKDLLTERAQEEQKQQYLLHLQHRLSKAEYLKKIHELQEHIARGDIYEINYCMEFFADVAKIDPLQVYKKLNRISEAPFSALTRFQDNWVISSSPERFFKKKGDKIMTQPIKGTARRSVEDKEDERLKQQLLLSLKERTENVMIVDVARNDLSRVAQRGSVKVEELFGLYTFRQVHQLVSTISCELRNKTSFQNIVQATFPMASMTGAPKISAMKLIEELEVSRRGLYSGALGYIDPGGNMDFSVLIRSIFYNANTTYLSFSVGGAITYLSDPEKEYEECLIKARAMFEALGEED